MSDYFEWAGILRITTAVLALAAAGTLTATGPASAHVQQRAHRVTCPDDSICFWPQPYFRGQSAVVQHPTSTDCAVIPGRLAQSVINNTDLDWVLYYGPGCTGDSTVIGPHDNDPYLRTVYSFSG
ncbi:peptidase inhibitor family I36 protein [Nonomuraea sp. NPDC049695]|uniref:peptidase inhibitor family I36 protein n=1 Tax=Nonomuraea sp. NPDC049695 TaxID=3154734 RepID=UPI00341523DE